MAETFRRDKLYQQFERVEQHLLPKQSNVTASIARLHKMLVACAWEVRLGKRSAAVPLTLENLQNLKKRFLMRPAFNAVGFDYDVAMAEFDRMMRECARPNYRTVILVAVDDKNGIAKDGRMPWHGTPESKRDLRRFKDRTKGGTVVMGRKTWESLPRKPLPDRKNVVLTRNKNYKAEGATVVSDLADIEGDDYFVIGGAQLYREFKDRGTWIVSRIPGDWQCDTFIELPTNYYADT